MIYNNEVKSFIINTKQRRDRKIKSEKQLKRRNLKSNFFIQPMDSNPIEGNKNSHISLIKKCIEDGLEKVLILEDDFKIIENLDNLPPMPEKWDILYLGGNVQRKLEPTKEGWVRCISKCHHAYIVNLKNSKMISEMEKCLTKKGKKYDDFMAERIHPVYRCLMLNPMRVIQYDDYSDMTLKFENYANMSDSINGFFTPQNIMKNEHYNLKLPEMDDNDLPNISIITLVKRSRDIFSLTLRSFEESFYPKEKIEWIIVEDTPEKEDCVKDLLPKDKRIKYIYLKMEDGQELSVNRKRDYAVQYCNNEIIVVMDSESFYCRENLLSRVKLLLKYPKQMAVGTNRLGFYDIVNKKSYMNQEDKQRMEFSSLSFRKKLWEECNFNESKDFFEGRRDMFIKIPHTFIQYGLYFNTEDKQVHLGQQLFNFYDTWDLIDQEFIDNLGNYIKNKSKFNEIETNKINVY